LLFPKGVLAAAGVQIDHVPVFDSASQILNQLRQLGFGIDSRLVHDIHVWNLTPRVVVPFRSQPCARWFVPKDAWRKRRRFGTKRRQESRKRQRSTPRETE
jgi:hypothetical protein